MDDRQSFEIGEDVFYQPMDDEVVLLNLKSQQYYGLDEMGSRIWHLLLECGDIQTVVDLICDEYYVDRDRALGDIQLMVKDFCDVGLMRARTGSPKNGSGTAAVDKF